MASGVRESAPLVFIAGLALGFGSKQSWHLPMTLPGVVALQVGSRSPPEL